MRKEVMVFLVLIRIFPGWRLHIKTRIKKSCVELGMVKDKILRIHCQKHQDQGIITCLHLWINIIKLPICFIKEISNPESRNSRDAARKRSWEVKAKPKIIWIYKWKTRMENKEEIKNSTDKNEAEKNKNPV